MTLECFSLCMFEASALHSWIYAKYLKSFCVVFCSVLYCEHELHGYACDELNKETFHTEI